MAAVEAGKELLWMRDFIGELGIRQEEDHANLLGWKSMNQRRKGKNERG